MNSFKRSERVQELLRHEISQEILRMADSRLGFITITQVHISEDLMDAKVYYSLFGPQEGVQLEPTVLKELCSHLRYALGRKLESLKRVPALRFYYDDSAYKAQRLGAVLNQLSQENPETFKEPFVPEIVPEQDPSKPYRKPRRKKD